MIVDLVFEDQPEFQKQIDLFLWIWETRPHRSELTRAVLLPYGHPKWHWQFLHVLPKGSYPHFKLYAKNIILGLPEEHDKQNEYEYFNTRYEELTREYYEKVYGKQF